MPISFIGALQSAVRRLPSATIAQDGTSKSWHVFAVRIQGARVNRMGASSVKTMARASMEPDKRIEELEREVQTLRGMVRQLLHESGQRPMSMEGAPVAERRKTPVHMREPALFREILGRIDHVLTGGSGDSLEAHIGAVWLSRLAVLAILTAFALAARATLIAPGLGSAEKVAIGYLVGVSLAALGFFFRRSYDVYAHALLGCGLAGLYFTTYAACFIEGARIEALGVPWLAFPAVSAGLIALTAAAYVLRSPSVAGIGLAMAYYTIAVSSRGVEDFREQVYALFTCSEIALAALLVFTLNGWRLLSWSAVIGTHLTYYLFFLRAPQESVIGHEPYYWFASGFYVLSSAVLMTGLVIDTRRRGPLNRHNGAIVAVHSLIFIVLLWLSVPTVYYEHVWMFRAGWTVLFAAFASLAWRIVGPRCYLFQLFSGFAGILGLFVCQGYLATHQLPIALALAGVAAALVYKRMRLPVFRALGLLALLGAAVAMTRRMDETTTLRIGSIAAEAGELAALGVAVVCVAAAWIHDRVCSRSDISVEPRPGVLFMARSILNQDSAVMSMLNAAVAAFVLLFVTVSERGESVRLPYLLAAEGLALAVLGIIARVRPVEAASAILLAAAHVAFYVFLTLPVPGFREQSAYVPLTLALAALTYCAAYLWERYLRRLGGSGLERQIAGVLPYAAATALLVYLSEDALPAVTVPATQAALGAAIMAAGVKTGHYSPVAAGLLALAIGAAHFLMETAAPGNDIVSNLTFPLALAFLLFALVAGERALHRIPADHPEIAPLVNGLRALLVLALLVSGILGLSAWLEERAVVFGLLALAVGLLVAGTALRESAYRWAALALFGLVAVRIFLIVRGLAPVWQVLSFASTGAVMLAVSLSYARARQRMRRDSLRRAFKSGRTDELS